MRLSLLPTGPPPVFQHWWVRPSTARYGRFSLPMGRSPGFASIAPDLFALFGLAFALAPPLKGLTAPGTITRRIIMQKARGQAGPKAIALPPLVGTGFQAQCPPPIGGLPTGRSASRGSFPAAGGPEGPRPPPAGRRGVSGSVSSPGRGSSHRSVALLGSLSVVIECLALREGPRRFRPGFTCPTLLGYRSGGSTSLADGAVTRCGAPFQGTSAGRDLGNSHMTGPTTPPGVPDGLDCSPFAPVG